MNISSLLGLLKSQAPALLASLTKGSTINSSGQLSGIESLLYDAPLSGDNILQELLNRGYDLGMMNDAAKDTPVEELMTSLANDITGAGSYTIPRKGKFPSDMYGWTISSPTPAMLSSKVFK